MNPAFCAPPALQRVLLARATTRRGIAGSVIPNPIMPTLEERERQARRRPFGRTICDICLDLAVVAEFCSGPLWNELFELMLHVPRSGTDL